MHILRLNIRQPVNNRMSEQVTSVAYHNFINTCRNSTTQKSYKKSLEYFMRFLKVDNWDKLLEPDPKTIQVTSSSYRQ